jgi:predicted dehydrogenase
LKSLVVGYGSIGARHARILAEEGSEVQVVSRHAGDLPYRTARTIAQGLAGDPEYVIIANRTGDHRASLDELATAGFTGRVLVEKPLFAHTASIGKLPFASCHVAYNLRFHPLVRRMQDEIADDPALSAMAYAGQYLPEWRPGSDYRESYSARAVTGGGALRDLSHELDLLIMLFGRWIAVFAAGGKQSSLEIDSDDVFALQLGHAGCPIVQLQLNYLDRPGRRFLLVNTNGRTLQYDLVKQTWQDGATEETVAVERDETYRAMHRDILGGGDRACTFADALEVLELIAAAERSAAAGAVQWSH